MRSFARFVILLIAVQSCSVFSAQNVGNVLICDSDSLPAGKAQEVALMDTSALDNAHHPLSSYPDSLLDLNRPYNRDFFKFRYDASRARMRNPWIADALREVLFR